MGYYDDSRRTKEFPCPYPQRSMEPGDWVMVLKTFALPGKETPLEKGYRGVITDYAIGNGCYIVDNIPYTFHRTELFPFEWEWSCT